ncbi:MAG: adenylate/guanylate cyclase domain-containing protein [Magnetococcales bacterium]|nr:adenylate/guanylate cyclase domain-containing protein [Magnetococcales bacterium]
MTRWHIGRNLAFVGVTLLFLLHGFGMIHLPLLERGELALYDFKVRQTAPETKDPRISIVDIDDKSLATLGPWPWPRDRLAALVDILFEHYRIGVLGFDMVFPDADPTSGIAQLESLAKGALSQDHQYLAQLNKLRPILDRDRVLSQSLRERPVILGFQFFQSSFSGMTNTGRLPSPVMTLRELGYDDLNSVKAFGYVANLSVLQEAAAGAGFIDNPLADPDGVMRRFPLLQTFNAAIYPSLPLGIIRAILGDPHWTLGIRMVEEERSTKETSLEWVAPGQHKIPVDPQGAILIPFRGRQGSFRYYSAADILDRVPDKKTWDAAIVLVGSSSGDKIRPSMLSPMGKKYPSVEIFANIISGLMDGTVKRTPASAPWPTVALLGITGVLLSLLFPWMTLIWRLVTVVLLALLCLVVNIYLWQNWHLHLPWLVIVIMLVTMLLVDMLFELFIVIKRGQLAILYGKHLPPKAIDGIVRSGGQLPAHGERREMTVAMSTIHDFSHIINEISPGEMQQWLHACLSPLTEIIHRHHGTLDHYHGGSIVALWGAPLPDPQHAHNAVVAAMEMVSRLTRLEDEFRMRGWPVVRCQLAILTGPMTCGVLGSYFRRDWMALGEPMLNVEWLSSMTPRYGSQIIVGEHTRLLIPDMIFRELDRVVVDGRDEAMSLYEPIGWRGQLTSEAVSRVDSFHRAVTQFRSKDWDLAEKGLTNLLQLNPEDRVCEIYLSRIRRFRKTPLPSNWNGVCRPPPA